MHPRRLHASIQSERLRREQREGRILADIVVRRSVRHFDGAVSDRVRSLQAGNDFAGGKALNLKLVVGCFGHRLRKNFGSAVDGIQRLRKARRQSPLHLSA